MARLPEIIETKLKCTPCGNEWNVRGRVSKVTIFVKVRGLVKICPACGWSRAIEVISERERNYE